MPRSDAADHARPSSRRSAIGAGAALVVGVAPLEIWKRRHPIITPAQYITDLRRNAHWNLAMPTVPHGRYEGAEAYHVNLSREDDD